MRKNGMQNLTRNMKGAWVHNDTGVYATIKKVGCVAIIKTFHANGNKWDEIHCNNFGWNVMGLMLGMIKQCNDGKSEYTKPKWEIQNKSFWRLVNEN